MRSDTTYTPAVIPTFAATNAAGDPSIPPTIGLASRAANCGARKVEGMSSPCSVANDTYSGTSADGRCGAEGTAATIGVMVVDGCSSVAGPPSWGRPSKLRQTIADPTAVSVLRD